MTNDASRDIPGFDPTQPPRKDNGNPQTLTREQVHERFLTEIVKSEYPSERNRYIPEKLLAIRGYVASTDRIYYGYDPLERRFFPRSTAFFADKKISVEQYGEGDQLVVNFTRGEKVIVGVRFGSQAHVNDSTRNQWSYIHYNEHGDLSRIISAVAHVSTPDEFAKSELTITADPPSTQKNPGYPRDINLQELYDKGSIQVQAGNYNYNLRYEYDKERDGWFVFLKREGGKPGNATDTILLEIPVKINPQLKEEVFPTNVFQDPYEADPDEDKTWKDIDWHEKLGGLHWERYAPRDTT